MYIYKSHMGGLYTSNYLLEWEDLYCDECFDSDEYVGEAHTIEDAWNLLKKETSLFDYRKCDKCNKFDTNDCKGYCEDNPNGGEYSYYYIMDFLEKNFSKKTNNIYYILVSKHINCNDMIFVNVKPPSYKFGEVYDIPKTFAIDEKVTLQLENLEFLLDNHIENSTKKIAEKYINKNKYILYGCLSNEPGEEWKETAHSCGNSWYGYVKIDSLENKFLDKNLLKFIKENIDKF